MAKKCCFIFFFIRNRNYIKKEIHCAEFKIDRCTIDGNDSRWSITIESNGKING